ncbi:MAG: DUF4340 domain-containing protein [Myxococcales bacterium]|nr:DUF4340 domain-containing protein [Myxococcales bacterium]
MLWRRTAILLIACGVLTLVAALLAALPSGGKGPELQLPAVDKTAVAKITVTRLEGPYSLVKTGEKWTVEPGGFPADQTLVDRALDTLTALRFGPTVSAKSASHSKYEVEDGRLTVALHTAKGAAWELIVGKDSADNRGTYARKAGDDRVYVALARLRDLFGKDANRWRDHVIVKFDPQEAARLTVADNAQTLSFKKNDAGAWEFDAPPENLPAGFRLDSEKVARIARTIANLNANDFEDSKEAVDRGLEPPRTLVTVETAKGEKYAVKLGADKDKNVYVQRDGNEQIYLVNTMMIANVRKSLLELRDMHVAFFDPAKAAKVTILDGARQLVFEKAGEDKWKIAESSEAVPQGFILDDAKVATLARSASTLQGLSFVGQSAPAAAKLGSAGSLIVALEGGGEQKIQLGAEAPDDQRYVGGNGYVYLIKKSGVDRLLKKLDDMKVTAQRSNQMGGIDPSMLDKLPPQLREQFMQQQRQKILQNQMMQQMMKKAEKQKQAPKK